MRLQVTRRADLAVRALIALDQAERLLKGADLSERLDATTSFMAQVMKPLVRARWVESGPGPTGGYRLLVALDELSLLDVVEAVEGPTNDGSCIVRGMCGDSGYCALHNAWTAARTTLSAHLAETTIAAAATAVAFEGAQVAPVTAKEVRR